MKGKIDFEAHMLYLKQLELQHGLVPALTPMMRKQSDIGEGRIRDMDEKGIAVQLLSGPSRLELLGPERGIALGAEYNDLNCQASQKFPGRLLGLATVYLDPERVDVALRELERCHEMGFPGWLVHSNNGFNYIDEPCYRPLFRKAVELGMFVYLHPSPPLDERYTTSGPMLMAGMGFIADVSHTVLRLICSGLFDELPELRLVIGHMGEGLPYSIDRISAMGGVGSAPGNTPSLEKGASGNPAVNQKPAVYYMENNIWVTNSGFFSVPGIRCAYERLGAERLLYGTDYPMENLDEIDAALEAAVGNAQDLEKIHWRNAEKFFGIKLPE